MRHTLIMEPAARYQNRHARNRPQTISSLSIWQLDVSYKEPMTRWAELGLLRHGESGPAHTRSAPEPKAWS